MLSYVDHVHSRKQPHRLYVVVYYIPDGFEPKIKSHGNSKSEKPYCPTLSSTMAAMASEQGGPKKVVWNESAACLLVIPVHYPGVNNKRHTTTSEESKP